MRGSPDGERARPETVAALETVKYLAAVSRMRTDGFRLAAASVGGKVGAVAGFRTMEMLYCGHILSIDDLVTDEAMRSKGLGKALLEWLSREAQRLGCGQVHLDSGLHRLDAHRFYERESFKKTAFHFAARLLRQKRTHTSLPKAGDHFSRIASASSQSFNLDGATREKVYNNATSGITGNAGSNTGASSSGQRTT